MLGTVTTGAAAALALALAAPAAAEGAGPLDPCLVPRADVPAYVEAFRRDGWKPAVRADRVTAANAVGEILFAMQIFAPTFVDAADARDYLDGAHESGRAYAPDLHDRSVLMMRDGAWLHVVQTYERSDGGLALGCLLVAQDLPFVDAAVATHRQTGQIADALAFAWASLDLPLPEGTETLNVDAIAMDWPDGVVPPPLVNDGLIVSAIYLPEALR